jgi:hypothetical protein
MASLLIAIGAISLLVAIVIVCTAPPYKHRITQRESEREEVRTLAITGAFGLALLAGLLSYFASPFSVLVVGWGACRISLVGYFL